MMMMKTIVVITTLLAFLTNTASAFSIQPAQAAIKTAATAAVVAVSTSPLVAIAEEVDEYEYGAVNAPIGLAWGAGVLAILTALLPVVLQGGEEAFEEMKDRDSEYWGTANDALKKRK